MYIFQNLIANSNVKLEYQDSEQIDLQMKHVLGKKYIVFNSRFLY